MAFITTESGICLSPSGETVYPTCGDIVTEYSPEQYVRTDGERPLNLRIDGACSDAAVPSFYCAIERKTVDSGKFVKITNTCTLPFTITGFRNSDPQRFSIFTSQNGNATYSSGNTTMLPLTVDPFRSVNIPTFFHPTLSELETGTAGTFDNMIGDQFGAKIEIYPGVPLLNCATDENSCDSYFTLSGRLICDTVDLPDFLSNAENFVPPNLDTLATIQSSRCLSSTPIMSYNIPSDTSSIANQFSGLSGAAEYFPAFLGNGWLNLYGDMGYSGALGTFYRLVTGTMSAFSSMPQFLTIGQLLGQSIEDYRVASDDSVNALVVSGSYSSNNYTTLVEGGYTYTGMRFEIIAGENTAPGLNYTLFFDVDIVPGSTDDVRMFIVQSGNYGSEEICEVGQP